MDERLERRRAAHPVELRHPSRPPSSGEQRSRARERGTAWSAGERLEPDHLAGLQLDDRLEDDADVAAREHAVELPGVHRIGPWWPSGGVLLDLASRADRALVR